MTQEELDAIREDIPALLAYIAELRSENQRLQKEVATLQHVLDGFMQGIPGYRERFPPRQETNYDEDVGT